MISWYAKVMISALLILPICIGLVWLIRRRLTPGSPVGAMVASIAAMATTLVLVAVLLGLDASLLFPGLFVIAAFAGTICSQPHPWSPSAILRALAVSSGGIAIIAVLTANHAAAALALLATGVLIKLYSDAAPKRTPLSEDVRSGTSAA